MILIVMKLEGRNPVLEAIKAGSRIEKILVSGGDRKGSINKIIALAKEKSIPVLEVDRSKLDLMSETNSHQGVIAYAAVKEYVDLDDILNSISEKNETAFLVILDGITDTFNFGSILRSADASGVHGVIIPKHRAVGLTPAVAKASAGAVEYVPVAQVTNVSQTIEYLKKKNIWITGTDSNAKTTIFRNDFKCPTAIVIGSEGSGMSRIVKERCDFLVSIPMKGGIQSLNAAVAGAIVMFEVVRQRSGGRV